MQTGPVSVGTVPLRERLFDLLLVLYFIIYVFTVTFTDLHNFTASYLGVSIPELEHLDMPYPPIPLKRIYFAWGRTVDPLLYENPMFWQVMEWVNLLCLMPFSVVATIAFLFGYNWIRNPAIITSSFTFYSLLICIGTTLYGENPTPNPVMFVNVYLPYLIFPFLVLVRMWPERPFSQRMGWPKTLFLTTVALVSYSFFFIYCYKWLQMQLPELVDPLVPPFVLPMVHKCASLLSLQ